MIEVSMMLNSYGLGTDCKQIGKITITNDGTGSYTRGNYIIRQFARGSNRVVRKGEVKNWPRLTKSPVQLLAACLKSLGH